MLRFLTALLTGLLLLAGGTLAKFPDGKTITIVVPFPPGGSTDAGARLLAERMAASLGSPVIVDNRPGGGTVIGMQRVMNARPDGLTLFYAGTSGIFNPHLRSDSPPSMIKEMKPVSLLMKASLALAVRNDHPAKTLGELIAMAKKEPGKMQVGFPAVGSANHLALERFMKTANIDVQPIPFPGNAQHVTALLGGVVSVGVENYLTLAPHLQTGQLRALAVTSRERWRQLPNVPTIEESGYPGYEMYFWTAIYAPKDTPDDIAVFLSAEFDKALKDPEVARKLQALGFEVAGGTPEMMDRYAREQDALWGKIIRDNKIKID